LEFEVHDVAQYITWNLPPVEFYIQDLLPKEGSMILFAAPKAKKSFLAQYGGFCIATGTDFLGMRTVRGRVMIAQFEISPLAYHWRLRRMSAHFTLEDQYFYEVSPGVCYLNRPENYNGFAAVVRNYAPNVLILDCLQACYGGDENDTEKMGQFIENVSAIMRENHCSLILVHHSRKAPAMSGSFSETVRGTRLAGWADTLVNMVKQPTGVQLQVDARQSDHEVAPINIRLEDDIWVRR
jgi:RecA-family ATPase